MSGVEILNQWEVAIDYTFSWAAFWWGALIGFVFVAAVALFVSAASFDWKAYISVTLGVGICTAVIAGAFAGFVIAPKPTKYETHYEVLVSDEVSLTEFNERYEIVDTRGTIYTVREK